MNEKQALEALPRELRDHVQHRYAWVEDGDSGMWIPRISGGMGLTDGQALFANAIEATKAHGRVGSGGGVWDGISSGAFSGSVNGTSWATNEAAGFSGNFADYQVAGVRKFSVDAAGNVRAGGAIAGAGAVIVPTYEYIQDVQNQVAAASYAVNHGIFAAPNSNETWQVVAASVRFTTAGGASCAVTVEVAGAAVAPGSGTAQLTATMSLTGAANTTVNGTIIAAPTVISAGSSVNLVFSGTVTGLLGAVVTVVLQRLS